ncbi:MAG: hypothetical protein EOP10_00945 [Proteobacteria bacterium]|nr:MAG: hypothetical protein EOP10_00945 [Pseudomonadota bacterium]
MLGMISKSIALGTLITMSVACSEQAAPKAQKIDIKSTHLRDRVTTNAPARTPANALLSCDEIWTSFVAANPLGYSKTYQATTTTEYLGGQGLPAPETVVESSKDTVTASGADSVSIAYEYTTSADPAPIPAETQTLTKADFIAQCNAPVEATTAPAPTAAGASAPTVEVLEQGVATITVGAGEFETDFVSGKITQAGDNSYSALASEWYLTGTNFLVKSTFESTSMFDTISVKTTQVVELIELLVPEAAASVPAA